MKKNSLLILLLLLGYSAVAQFQIDSLYGSNGVKILSYGQNSGGEIGGGVVKMKHRVEGQDTFVYALSEYVVFIPFGPPQNNFENHVSLQKYTLDGTIVADVFYSGGFDMMMNYPVSYKAGGFDFMPNDSIVLSIAKGDEIEFRVFDKNLSQDIDFGSGGVASFSVNNAKIPGLTYHSSGIYFSGYEFGGMSFLLGRMTRQGQLDTSFDGDGKLTGVIHGAGQQTNMLNDVKVQNDGKIICTGYTVFNADNDYQMWIMRVNSNGFMDNTFGTNGHLYPDPYPGTGTEEVANRLSLLSSGKYLISGYALTGSGYVQTAARINDDGTQDNSFGNGGWASTNSINGKALDCVLMSDESFVFIGSTYDMGASKVLNSKFTSGGLVSSDFYYDNAELHSGMGSTNIYANSATLLSDSSLYFGGNYLQNGSFGEVGYLAKMKKKSVQATNNLNYLSERVIEVFPNPTQDNVSISFHEKINGGVLLLSNSSGKIIQALNVTENSLLHLDLPQESGIYFIKLITEDQSNMIKVIKH